ncbi:MAG: 1-(5-phosphoribosyl)-5-[(5-phosphoribosylamino)methylideneamino]imidazole-4-carboxamide isomerase [Ignavibacteriaceae bacterium]
MLIIPAIDIYKNKTVRLKKGNFEDITYYNYSPLEIAKRFKEMGLNTIHIVDLEGSKTGNFSILNIVSKIKEKTGLQIEFGGGVRDLESVDKLISAGVDNIIIGSLSIKNRKVFESIINKHSNDKIITAIDVEDEIIRISGWTEDTNISVYEHITYCTSIGIKRFLCTDISKDGMLMGTNIELYKKVLKKFPPIELIASGGIKGIDGIIELKKVGLFGVIVGKALYEGTITLKELAEIAV